MEYASKVPNKEKIQTIDDLAAYIVATAFDKQDEGMINVIESYARTLRDHDEARADVYQCYVKCWHNLMTSLYHHGGYLPTRSWPKED